ncbi:long-chain fatty acid--CoA ligase [Aeromicrobium panaciterrae]|uniref:class I adenylate-forming enzyme family protein n=1 Tax=Aeromicrobium panaciterrae TaxID=363861 RepID=UPI0031D6FD04
MQLSGLAPGDWVTLHARFVPSNVCLASADGEVRTFEDVNRRVTRLVRALQGVGVIKGDRVAIMAVDSPDYVEVVLACMKLGATYVALNFRLAPAEVRTVLLASEAKVVFLSGRYEEIIEGCFPEAGAHVTTRVTFDSSSVGDLPTYEDFLGSGPDGGEIESVTNDDDILSISFTSGTTGTPKGVMQSQRMIKAITQSGALELGIRPGDLLMSGAPLFHAGGMGHVLYGVSRGGGSVVMPQWDVDVALRWLQSGQVRQAMLVPSMIIQLLAHPRVHDSDYGQLRSIMYGGAPMPTSVIRQMIDVFGADLHNGFGAGTEAGGQLVLRPEDHRRAIAGEEWLLGAIGKPAFGCDVKVVDAEGVEVPDGEIGEIASRGDTVMSGYLNQPELTARSVRKGWFVAGDLAWKDKEGYLHLSGRADDMIVRGGENIYPVEIEDVIGDHPHVGELAIVGEPDDHFGQVVTAVVVLKGGGQELTVEQVREHCRGRLASYKLPTRVVVVDEFPRNASGKIHKTVLRAQLADGTL